MIQLLERQQDYPAIAAELSQKLSNSAVEYARDTAASRAIAQLREAGLLTNIARNRPDSFFKVST